MARKGHTKVIYKGTFVCKQTLGWCLVPMSFRQPSDLEEDRTSMLKAEPSTLYYMTTFKLVICWRLSSQHMTSLYYHILKCKYFGVKNNTCHMLMAQLSTNYMFLSSKVWTCQHYDMFWLIKLGSLVFGGLSFEGSQMFESQKL